MRILLLLFVLFVISSATSSHGEEEEDSYNQTGIHDDSDEEEHECDGILIDDVCMCECEHPFHIAMGPDTHVGKIVGIHLDEYAAIGYTIISLVLLTILYTTVHSFMLGYYFIGFKHIADTCMNFLSKKTKSKKTKQVVEYVLNLVQEIRIPDSGFLIVVGVLFGLFVKYTGILKSFESPLLQFNQEFYSLILIPAMLLSAGFYLPLKYFRKNIIVILSQSILGTMLIIVIVALGIKTIFGDNVKLIDCLTFGSLISAIDHTSTEAIVEFFHEYHVNERLSILIHSESIFNDAVAIVFFRLFVHLKSGGMGLSGSETGGGEEEVPVMEIIGLAILKLLWFIVLGLVIGFVTGFLASFLTRFTKGSVKKHVSKHHKRENLHVFQLTILMAFLFLAYILAENLLASGVVALVFSSMFMSRYMKYNLSSKSKVTTKYVLEVLGKVCENIIFIYIGVSIVLNQISFNWVYIITANAFLFVSRIVVVFAILILYNAVMVLITKKAVFPLKEIFLYSLSGLKGSICFVLAFSIPKEHFDNKEEFVTTTLSVIVFTQVVQGTLLSGLLQILKIERSEIPVRRRKKHFKKIIRYISKITHYMPSDDHPCHLEVVRDLLLKEVNKNFVKLKDFINDLVIKMEHNEEAISKSLHRGLTPAEEDEKKWILAFQEFLRPFREGEVVRVDPLFGINRKDLEFVREKIENMKMFKKVFKGLISRLCKDQMEKGYCYAPSSIKGLRFFVKQVTNWTDHTLQYLTRGADKPYLEEYNFAKMYYKFRSQEKDLETYERDYCKMKVDAEECGDYNGMEVEMKESEKKEEEIIEVENIIVVE